MRQNKGFSLIEMLAALLVTSAIIVPLLFSLTASVATNDIMIKRSVATSMTSAALQGFQTMYYTDIENKINDIGNGHFLAFNRDNGCSILRNNRPFSPTSIQTAANNRALCDNIFEIQNINTTFDGNQYQVFVYPFQVEAANLTAYQNAIDQAHANGIIPDETLRDLMKNIPVGQSINILRVTVWIQYGDGSNQVVIRSGLLSPEMELD